MQHVKFLMVIVFGLFVFGGCKEDKKPAPQPVPQKDSVLQNNKQSAVPQPAGNDVYADIDISPMDMSYFPSRYPQLKMADAVDGPPIMRVIYSRPHLQGRKLFEGILKYGEVWRLGANESTELDVFQPVTIGGKKIPAGRYTIYAIPRAGYWTVAINKNLDIWGLKQDSTQDVTRVQIPVTYYNTTLEYFTMIFEKTTTGVELVMAWDDVQARLPIKI